MSPTPFDGVVRRPVQHLPAPDDSQPADHEDEVVSEEPLEIRVAGEPLAITMRTPGHDADLALGFLFAEGVIESLDDVSSIAHCGTPGSEGYGNSIDVIPCGGDTLNVERILASRRGTLTTSSCGVCGRHSVDDLLTRCTELPPGPEVSLAVVATSTTQLGQGQPGFARTGGSHAAAILDASGQTICCAEDIGRHNAVDKVVGAMLRMSAGGARRAPPPQPALLVISGRASYEIVQKSLVARLPIVASVSAVSSLAIDLAGRCNLTLTGFVREGSVNVYTHPERITDTTQRSTDASS